jgi:hypothetical protein
MRMWRPQVSSKKRNTTTLRLADENSEVKAVITVGEDRAVEHDEKSREDAGKPLYLRRM